MTLELVVPPALAGTVPYAYAAVTDPGRMVFTAGACPLDADGAVVAAGDVAGQARQVMTNLSTALEAAGAGLTDVLKTTVFVATTDRADLVAAWDVVRGRLRRPRRSQHAGRCHAARVPGSAGRGGGRRRPRLVAGARAAGRRGDRARLSRAPCGCPSSDRSAPSSSGRGQRLAAVLRRDGRRLGRRPGRPARRAAAGVRRWRGSPLKEVAAVLAVLALLGARWWAAWSR